jgi:hypothetical protein
MMKAWKIAAIYTLIAAGILVSPTIMNLIQNNDPANPYVHTDDPTDDPTDVPSRTPSAPVNFRYTGSQKLYPSSIRLDLTWVSPIDCGDSPISGYRFHENSTVYDFSASTFTVSTIVAYGTNVIFYVEALNAAGAGNASTRLRLSVTAAGACSLEYI